jgi:hypothetical protein
VEHRRYQRDLPKRLLCAVRLHMILGGFFRVVRGVHLVTMRQMCMMRRRLVIAFLVMFGSFPVVASRMLMVVGGLRVMMRSFLRHSDFLSLEGFRTVELESPVHCRKCTLQPRFEPVN